VFFTSHGHNSGSVFCDAPHRLGEGIRTSLSAYVDRDCCQPYYGLGNAVPREASLLDRPALPNYYTYRRDRMGATLDLQWRLLPAVRLLTGVAAQRNAAAARDSSTLFGRDLAGGTLARADDPATALGPKVGLVVDTRDAERDPRRACGWRRSPGRRCCSQADVISPVSPRRCAAT
jgi:hypothetical protein